MIDGQFYRGVIYAAFLEHVGEEKYYVVVSNNGRNRQLDTALAARITSSPKPPIASIVPIQPGERVHGSVLCDDIEVLYPGEVRNSLGAFSPSMMRKIDEGLRAAFDLWPG